MKTPKKGRDLEMGIIFLKYFQRFQTKGKRIN